MQVGVVYVSIPDQGVVGQPRREAEAMVSEGETLIWKIPAKSLSEHRFVSRDPKDQVSKRESGEEQCCNVPPVRFHDPYA